MTCITQMSPFLERQLRDFKISCQILVEPHIPEPQLTAPNTKVHANMNYKRTRNPCMVVIFHDFISRRIINLLQPLQACQNTLYYRWTPASYHTPLVLSYNVIRQRYSVVALDTLDGDIDTCRQIPIENT